MEVEETNDEIKWTVSRAAGSLLQELALLLGDEVFPRMIQFVGDTLNVATWQQQYVGMFTLGNIIEGPTTACIELNFNPACY